MQHTTYNFTNLQFIKLPEEDLRILTDKICLAKKKLGIYNNLLLFLETAGSLQLNRTLNLLQLVSWALSQSAAFFSHIQPTVFCHQFAAADFTLPSPKVHDTLLG